MNFCLDNSAISVNQRHFLCLDDSYSLHARDIGTDAATSDSLGDQCPPGDSGARYDLISHFSVQFYFKQLLWLECT